MAKSTKKKAKPKLETWDISKLEPHEKQADYFEDLSDGQLERLADSIKRNGVETPPDILPDGTIIKGHQRVRALKKLGRKQVKVRVRHDLVGDELAIEYELLSDNVDRRQLDPIEMAQCFRRMKQLLEQQGTVVDGSLRDLAAKPFGMTGRNAEYLEEILDAPKAVRRAVSRKVLGTTTAGKIVKLPKDKQRKLAKEIDACLADSAEDEKQLRKQIRAIVAKYLPKPAPKPKKPARKAWNPVTHLERAVAGLSQASPAQLAAWKTQVRSAYAKLEQVVRKAEGRNVA